MATPVSMTGIDALNASLKALHGVSMRAVVRQSVLKGVRIIAKAIKARVPPKMKKLKPFIGHAMRKARYTHVTEAKAGVASGKKMKKLKPRAGRKGVGIGAQNAHWFILGTEDRWTGYKTKRRTKYHKDTQVAERTQYFVTTGNKVKYTGRMPPQAPGIVQAGKAASQASAIAVIDANLKAGIIKTLRKHGKIP